MNAGGEYVLYRIWATLQDRNGIHAESLLTCVGALAGHACQVYARRARVDVRSPLIDSRLSIWSMVSRTLQKLGEPLPDIREVVEHASRSAGGDAHVSRDAPSVYLKQIWPQILPVAQRFCRQPMQLPVLFGIALQRAIEHTRDQLSPTLAARIAMESAVAMARVVLVESGPEPRTPSDEVRTPQRRERKNRNDGPKAPSIGLLVARIPPGARIVTMASVAFMTFAGLMYEGRGVAAPEGTREMRQLVAASPSSTQLPALAAALSNTAELDVIDSPTPFASGETFDEIPGDPPTAYIPPSLSDSGMDEGIMRDEFGQPLTE